jgi:(p)ppGpp synthase/HD superfamily hydrolase
MSMKKALVFASKAYSKQHIMHPVAVALAAGEWGLPREIQEVALLHDIFTRTSVRKAELVDTCGEYIADVVEQLAKESPEHLQGVSQYAKIIKMLEIIDNLQDIELFSVASRKVYIDESKELFKVLQEAHWRIANKLMEEIIEAERKCMIA